MGGCYSTAGHSHRGLATSRHKMPRDAGSRLNGKTSIDPYGFKSAMGLPGEDFHQSLKRKSKDIDARNSQVDSSVQGLTSAEAFTAPDSMQLLMSDLDGQLTTGVVPSDSGIESIGSPQEETVSSEPQELMKQEPTLCWSCQQKLRRLSRGSCQQCGNLRVDPSHSPVLLVEDTYCTCGPRRLGTQPICRTHKSKAKLDPANRHSDFDGVGLKSGMKKNRLALAEGKRLRMSWKSTDSVDLNMSLCTCMDQAKSVASEIFGDDVSFRAPLAQFDSVDCRLDDRSSFHAAYGGGPMASHRLSIYSEVINLVDCGVCKCDHPVHVGADGSKKDQERGQQDNAQGNTQANGVDPTVNGCSSSCIYPPLVTKMASRLSSSFSVASSDERMDSESPLRRLISDKRDHGCRGSELCHLSELVLHADHDVFDETEKLLPEEAVPAGEIGTTSTRRASSLDLESGLCHVCTRGRRVVIMDQEMYTQMLRDLAFLREQLGQLSEVIQNDTVLPEQLSFSEDNET